MKPPPASEASLPAVCAEIGVAEWSHMRTRARPPVLLDLREGTDFRASEWLVAGARRLDPDTFADGTGHARIPARAVVFASTSREREHICAKVRAWGCDAKVLAGPGATLEEAIAARGRRTSTPVLRLLRKRPDLGVDGEKPSRWVTRSRPKVDRVACAWLIRRFIDPDAVIHFVEASKVDEVARQEGATLFDVEGAPISHQWEQCSFDSLLEAFGLDDPALGAMARIVRAADTTRLSLSTQASGLLALSLGLSIHHGEDDDGMLQSAIPIYDGLHAWCACGAPTRHDWREHLRSTS